MSTTSPLAASLKHCVPVVSSYGRTLVGPPSKTPSYRIIGALRLFLEKTANACCDSHNALSAILSDTDFWLQAVADRGCQSPRRTSNTLPQFRPVDALEGTGGGPTLPDFLGDFDCFFSTPRAQRRAAHPHQRDPRSPVLSAVSLWISPPRVPHA